ncbi:unnamed protein product [Vicia faba]|uniref:Aminotransferase class I/classII large domain-containing protein n=1 Tax=Vicia faba TaxID=3906 RepID=A0AAV0YD50_VICFA|nr:unnamed protein product [Vicia faba]
MFERTVTMNSLGKTFSLTGWKVGWAIAPPHLTWGVRQAHAFLTFATTNPMQRAAAVALRAPDSYYTELKRITPLLDMKMMLPFCEYLVKEEKLRK